MLFGKNKELRKQVDEWIDNKIFFHKMLHITNEQKTIILEKILTTDEKENFIACSRCYNKILKYVDTTYDDNEKIINFIKEAIIKLSKNSNITRTNRKDIYYELINQDAIEPHYIKEMDSFLDDPVKNNFDVDELYKMKRKQNESEKATNHDEKTDNTEDKDLYNDVDTENEKFDEYDDEDDSDDDDIDNDNDDEDDSDDDDIDNDDEDDSDDDDIDDDDEKQINFSKKLKNYKAIEFEEQNIELDYDIKKIERKIISFLDDEDYDALDSFTDCVLSYPIQYMDSIFVSVRFYSIRSLAFRLSDIKKILNNLLNNYSEKKSQKWIRDSINNINHEINDFNQSANFLLSIEDKAFEEEKEIEALINVIYEKWKLTNKNDDENNILNCLYTMQFVAMHYQRFSFKKSISQIIYNNYYISKDLPLDESIVILKNRGLALICLRGFIKTLFCNKKVSSQLKNNIDVGINYLNENLDEGNQLIQKYNTTKAKYAALLKARQESLEKNAAIEKGSKKLNKPKQSKLRNFINALDKLSKIGTSISSRDINDSLRKTPVDRNQYPIKHEEKTEPTVGINKEEVKIQKKLNTMTERDAALKLDAVCYCYGSSRSDHKNRMAKSIMEYIQVVQQNGLDNQPGYFNCGNLKKTFGIEFNDQPAVRYNKIATFRV